MAILFLDFYSNLEAKENIRYKNKNMYNAPLLEQFEIINNRLPLEKRFKDIQSFIQIFFPSGLPKKYYISCPNYKREIVQTTTTNFLRNVVLRADLGGVLQRSNYNFSVILIGDIIEGERLKIFSVKGIEILDAENTKSGETLILDACACSAFQRNKWSIPRVDYNSAYFTPNTILSLIKNSYPVKNYMYVINFYNIWNKYLEFREYYLKTQTKRHFKVQEIIYKEAFSVNRRRYQRNKDFCDSNLLDSSEEFAKGEQVVLENQLEDAESFHLIRVDVEFNRLKFAEKIIEKNNRKINEIESSIRSFARENLSLSTNPPSNENYNEQLRNSFQLEERFKIVKKEIEPDCNDLKQKREREIKNQLVAIESKYKLIIDKETADLLGDEERRVSRLRDETIDKYKIELENQLESDIVDLSDSKIRQEVAKLQKDFKKRLEKELEQRLKKLQNNKKNEKDKEKLDSIDLQIINLRKDYSRDTKNSQMNIDIRRMFVDRNEVLVNQKRNEINRRTSQEISAFVSETKRQLELKYQNALSNEKLDRQQSLEREHKKIILERIRLETIIRFSLYFKTDPEKQGAVQKAILQKKYLYLIYNNRAEEAKIARQRNALESFFEGNVKNPYLSTFLFSPEDLNKNEYKNRITDWFLERLNDKQKEAVKRAVSSNGVFLLQGPPGTGKTQVIAEIVGHLVKEGKKVLISSETHKAIDNVFERLPKIAEIRPIRLMTSKSGKDSDYSPENLVDNLYLNISEQMRKTITSYENFADYKENFKSELKELVLLNQLLKKNQKQSEEIVAKLIIAEQSYTERKEERNRVEDKKEALAYEKDSTVNTYKRIENNQFSYNEDSDMESIEECKESIGRVIDNKIFKVEIVNDFIKDIFNLKVQEIHIELNLIKNNKELYKLQEQKESLLKQIMEDFTKSDGERTEEIIQKQKQLKEVSKQVNESKDEVDLSNMTIGKIFNANWLKDNQDKALSEIENLRTKILEVRKVILNKLSTKIKIMDEEIAKINGEIGAINAKLKGIAESISELREDQSYHDYQDSSNKLEVKIGNFYKKFEIAANYKSTDEAIKMIETEWNELKLNFKKKEQENQLKIPMYRKISEYLQKEEVILEDRKEYTKPLFEAANLFGTTTTSRDRFDEKSMTDLNDYNLGELDLRKQGIDVVIIDEVSKSSFIDLLIPILYGKTVILVGDHRQLAPMYEYRNFRDEDYEGLDSEIINSNINKKYTLMYEESFFKRLFEKAPDDYKIMLTKQYRSHEHIMNVFNHFYNKNLELGDIAQNSNKKHYLNIPGNQRLIIEQDKHIYFIDSKDYESRSEDSTSIQNKGEADIVIELLKKIDYAYQKNTDFQPRVIKNQRIDERMSIGVICTYGDQARLIKQKCKANNLQNFKSFNENSDSKMIINTVDDFQGDERDIIIVSMVRNPREPAKSNPGFITAYQRINVAFSRAKRLLIIVGNKDYLTLKGVIDLPDVMGDPSNDQNNFHVYDKIIDTIKTYGKVLDDVDVIDERGDKK